MAKRNFERIGYSSLVIIMKTEILKLVNVWQPVRLNKNIFKTWILVSIINVDMDYLIGPDSVLHELDRWVLLLLSEGKRE